jgi:acetolactate synthase-1/2/3 large subunit
VTNDYTTLEAPRPLQRLVHVHPDPTELGRVYQANIPVNASAAAFAMRLQALPPVPNPRWRAWTEEAHREFLAYTRASQDAGPGSVNLAAVISHLSARLPAEATISNGAGNFAVWVHRFFKYKRYRTELAPTSGAMGYGVPAAIAAKLRFPERLSVCVAGDGDFMMYPQELATAMEFGAAVIFLIVNNGMYGTIRMHQERAFPGRVIGTTLKGPDYVALARSFGAYGETVESTAAFPDAFERAVNARRAAVLDLRTDPHQITPDRRI